MAAKTAKSKSTRTQVSTPVEPMVFDQPTYTPPAASENFRDKKSVRPVLWVLGFFALLCLWWMATNSWPVVAFVGMRPVFRHEVDKSLYDQYGDKTVQGMVVQHQIESALDKKGITVSDKEIDDKLNEIKSRLPEGTDFEAELQNQGLTLTSLKELLGIQLRLNKAADGQASVSAEDVDKYVKDNAKMLTATTAAEQKLEAENALKQDKLNTVINSFVEEAQKSESVWWWPTYKSAAVTPAPAPTN